MPNSSRQSLARFSLPFICLLVGFLTAPASPGWVAASLARPVEPWYRELRSEWGGEFQLKGSVSRADEKSLFQAVDGGDLYDGSIQARLKNRLFFGERANMETHYEAVLLGGDTREARKEFERLFPSLSKDGLLLGRRVRDDRRLVNLTWTIQEKDDYIFYHRLDRLSLTLLPRWGLVRIGRQAVTWGNGLLFNPMDLFNPFAPTDIERDYKIGDDMVLLHFTAGQTADFQTLCVPRRDPESEEVEWNQSSVAGKFHFAVGTTEFDILGAQHFDEQIVGIGSSGYLGSAAWRVDATWTFLEGGSDYLSLVANADYSWVWWHKNFYGFLEFFHSGVGNNDYPEAIVDPDIAERLDRGELFVLGRNYVSGHLRLEVHPLVNVFLTVINNLADPSGILQPRAIWEATEDLEVTVGGSLSYGESGSEFGGFPVAPGLVSEPADSAFVWLTFFF